MENVELQDNLYYKAIHKITEHYYINTTYKIIAITLSGYKQKPSLDHILYGLDKFGIKAKFSYKKPHEISNDLFPCVGLLKDETPVIINRLENSQLYYTDLITDTEKAVDMDKFYDIYSGRMILIEKSMDSMSTSVFKDFLKHTDWLLGVLKHFKDIYKYALVAAVFANILNLSVPLYTRIIYDKVIANNAISTLWVTTIGVIIALVFDFLLKTVKSFFIDFANKNAEVILSHNFVEKVFRLKMNENKFPIGIIASYARELMIIKEYLSSVTLNVFIDIPFALLFLALIFYIGGTGMFLVCLISIILMIIAGLFLKQVAVKFSEESLALNNKKNSFLIESMIGIETLKANVAEEKFIMMWDTMTEANAVSSRNENSIYSFSNNVMAFIQMLNYVLVIVLGFYLIMDKDLTMGGLIAVSILSSRALSPFLQAAVMIIKYNSVKLAYQSVSKIMHNKGEGSDEKAANITHTLKGDIIFDKITFHYDNEGEKILDNVSFAVRPGEKLAILGGIGSGKTTIGKLLLGLYTPETGNIWMDGINIKEINKVALRSQIGYVPQDVHLFSGSVLENLILNPLSRFNFNDNLQKAVAISGVNHFLRRKSHALQHHTTEGGNNFSEGQKKSLALARAFMTNPDIFIMDEPTSSMDKITENYILSQLAKNTKDKTMIIITHSLSVLPLVDKVLYLDSGQTKFFGDREKFIAKFVNKKQEGEGQN